MDRPIVLIEICSALVGVSYGRHSPLMPVFAREPVAADYSQVGLVGTVNYLPYMFAPLFMGILLDRLNKSNVSSLAFYLMYFQFFFFFLLGNHY